MKQENKYSEKYLQYLEGFKNAELKFNNNPCTKTATFLSNLREQKFKDIEKYTSEYLLIRTNEAKINHQNTLQRFKNLAQTMRIETMNISDETKSIYHKLNDLVNPINY